MAGKFGLSVCLCCLIVDSVLALDFSDSMALIQSQIWQQPAPAEDTVIALAAYNGDVSTFPLAYVNTLRGVGYTGNIFLGMWEGTPDVTGYLDRAQVTPKYMGRGPCNLTYPVDDTNYMLRATCTREFPHLKIEVSRFVYAKMWLEECSTCTGWTMVSDFSDVNFQRHPFAGLPDELAAQDTVFLTEEMAPRIDKQGQPRGADTNHWFVHEGVARCYGRDAARLIGGKPMLNIGTSLGTRRGILLYLQRLAQEFESNVAALNPHAADCDPLHIADQAVLNYLFYSGEMPFGKAMPYGKWIVNSMGMPCSPPPGSNPDHSAQDIVIIDQKGRVLNEDGTVPAIVHQGKVCFSNYDVPYVSKFSHAGDLFKVVDA